MGLSEPELAAAAARFWGLGWTLADVAAFTGLLRSGHQRTRDTEHAWKALQVSLRL